MGCRPNGIGPGEASDLGSPRVWTTGSECESSRGAQAEGRAVHATVKETLENPGEQGHGRSNMCLAAPTGDPRL